ncbi:hypothetical protein [Sphingomonas faeni]|nr:hypothetical protein [Sphingomonas faeni]
MSLLAMGLIVEMVFFGPLGLLLAGVPVRKVLIGALVVSSIVQMLVRKAEGNWQVWLLISIILFLLIWGFVVPLSNNIDLRMSVAEIQPFVAVLLVFPFYYLFAEYGPKPYLNILVISTAVMAVIVIFLWLCTNVLGLTGIGITARNFYTGLNDSDIGVYIGPMPDGSFRIMLINFVLFPIMMSYHNWDKPNIPWSAFYAVAIFATGTRAFLGVGAIIIGVALLRKRPVLAVPVVAALAGFASIYILNHQDLHIFDFSSDFTSSSARYVQFFSLMNLFWRFPIFGAGFGASAGVVRSFDAPYSYELTYVALLAKIGIVGALILGGALTAWIGRSMRASPNWVSIAVLVISVVLMTATNPYLINLVGMSIVAFMVAIGVWANRPVSALAAPVHQYENEV